MKQIVVKPLLTEKTVNVTANKWYAFVVESSARKGQIARSVADLYKVNVTHVRTASMHGKQRRAGKRQQLVAKSDWKKAFVRLAEGQKIDAFEAPSEQPKK